MSEFSSIKVIPRSEINIQKWDELVASSSDTVYQMSWFLDAVSDNWVAIVSGNYDAAIPFCCTKKKGVEIIYQPFFCREINFIGSEVLEDTRRKLINAIPDGFKLVEFSIKSDLEGWQGERKYYQQLEFHKVDLLVESFSKNLRRNIKKAESQGVSCSFGFPSEKFVEMVKLFDGKRLGFSPYNLEKLWNLAESSRLNNSGFCVAVQLDSEILGAALFVLFKRKLYYIHGVVSPNGRSLGAMQKLIHDTLLAYRMDVEVVDFGGSNVASVREFYLKFGAEDVYYYNYKKNTLPLLMRKIKDLRDVVKKSKK